MADPLSEVYLGRANTGGAVVYPQSRETAADYYLRSRDMERRQKALIDAAAARAGKSELSKPEKVDMPDFQGLLPQDQEKAVDMYKQVLADSFPLIRGQLSPDEYAKASIKAKESMAKTLVALESMKTKAQNYTKAAALFHASPDDYEDDAQQKLDDFANTGDISVLPKKLNNIDLLKSMQVNVKHGIASTDRKLADGTIVTKGTTDYDEPKVKEAFNVWLNTDNKAARILTRRAVEGFKANDPMWDLRTPEDQQQKIHDEIWPVFNKANYAEWQANDKYHIKNPPSGGINIAYGNDGASWDNGLFNAVTDQNGIISVKKKGGTSDAKTYYTIDGKPVEAFTDFQIDTRNKQALITLPESYPNAQQIQYFDDNDTPPPGTHMVGNKLMQDSKVLHVPLEKIMSDLTSKTINKGTSLFDKKFMQDYGVADTKAKDGTKAKKGKASETTLKFFQNATK